MTTEHITEAARSGKIEDELYCIFINDEQTEKLDDSLNLKDGDTLTFIRLTMLARRIC